MMPILFGYHEEGPSGILLSALTDRAHLDAVTALIFRETTSIGSAYRPSAAEACAEDTLRPLFIRASGCEAVERDGTMIITAEFEECKRIARERNLPLAEVCASSTRNSAHPQQPLRSNMRIALRPLAGLLLAAADFFLHVTQGRRAGHEHLAQKKDRFIPAPLQSDLTRLPAGDRRR